MMSDHVYGSAHFDVLKGLNLSFSHSFMKNIPEHPGIYLHSLVSGGIPVYYLPLPNKGFQ